MLLSSGNRFKDHEEVMSLQPMTRPRRFDVFPPLTGGCSEDQDAFKNFFNHNSEIYAMVNPICCLLDRKRSEEHLKQAFKGSIKTETKNKAKTTKRKGGKIKCQIG